MIEIRINGILIKTTSYIEDVRGIEIKTSVFPTVMERTQARALIKFLYDCTQRCTGVITYNNVIISKEDVRELKF